MNVRVVMAPPFWGGEIIVIFGTVLRATSPRVMRAPAMRRMASRRARRVAFVSSVLGASVPVSPRSIARISTQGMPLSIMVSSMPLIASMGCPVGKTAPQVDPSVSSNVTAMAADVPGTPSMRASPE